MSSWNELNDQIIQCGRCPRLVDHCRSVDRWLIGSYHPSQQNTFTGKLTRQMLDELFAQLDDLIGR